MSDTELAGAVERALEHEARLHPTDRVEVQAEQGIVTLLGVVCSATERRAVESIARRQRDVRDVVNQLTVSMNGKRSDRELQRAVTLALAKRDETTGIGCTVESGVVRLLGEIESPSQEMLAIWIAGSVPGVEDVISDLTISQLAPAPGELPIDTPTLVGRVTDALNSARIMIDEGGASVNNGIVTLTGKVDSRADRERAEQVVAGVEGLRAVRNRLVVKKSRRSRDPDERLAARVIEAMREDGRVSPATVFVDVYDGMVVLHGMVNSPDDHDAAEEIAWQVPGVHNVVNDLLIVGWQSSDRLVDTSGSGTRTSGL